MKKSSFPSSHDEVRRVNDSQLGQASDLIGPDLALAVQLVAEKQGVSIPEFLQAAAALLLADAGFDVSSELLPKWAERIVTFVPPIPDEEQSAAISLASHLEQIMTGQLPGDESHEVCLSSFTAPFMGLAELIDHHPGFQPVALACRRLNHAEQILCKFLRAVDNI